MKSRTRSILRWKNRRRERRRWCRPWNACANWCRPPRRDRRGWRLLPIRCRRCRVGAWIRWIALRSVRSREPTIERTIGRTTEQTTARATASMTARRAGGIHPEARRRDLVEEIRIMTRETQIVGFRVGRETYGVPITALHEIVRVPEITAVPDAPDYLEGVINLRGKIVSVIDLRKRFGQPATALDRRSRILVVEHRGRLAGVIVGSAAEVLKIPESDLEPAPSMMQEGGLGGVTGLGKVKGRLVVLLDMSKLLAPGSLQVAATGEAKAVAKETKATPKADARGASAR